MKQAVILETEFILYKVIKEFVPHFYKLYPDSRHNVPKDIYYFLKLRLKGLNEQKTHKDNRNYLLFPKARDVIGFKEYSFSQVETILDGYMDAEYILNDMTSHSIDANYRKEYGYKKYWDALVLHLREFIKDLYDVNHVQPI